MRLLVPLLAGLALLLGGCSLLLPVVEVGTRPLDKKATFAEIQRGYTQDMRFGLYDEALAHVEPALRKDFRAAQSRLAELRFSDVRIDAIEIDPLRTEAVATVVYRGYWLSSPFEREVTVTQRWRRATPGQQWYVTPDLGAILEPPAGAAPVSAAPTSD